MTQGKPGRADQRELDGPVLRLAYGIIWMSNHISVPYWINAVTGWKRDSVFYGRYVLIWLVLLLGLLAGAPMSGNWGLVVGSLALYRLQDMLLGTMGEAFASPAFKSQPYDGSWASKVSVVIVNIVQVVAIFAIAFLVFTTSTDFHPVPRSRLDYFYLSWNILPPLGSGVATQTTAARILVILESGAGALLILVALTRFLGHHDEHSASPPADTRPRAWVVQFQSRWRKEGGPRPTPWGAIAIIITGLMIGGTAIAIGPDWTLFWAGAVVVVAGGMLALSCRFFGNWC
jgi:hypothetical protein